MPYSSVIQHQKENVLIEAGDCSLTILPHAGGKIASISIRGKELLQGPLAPVAARTATMAFDEGDASGWDECLPSVAACSVMTANGQAKIPDHGDLWRVEWHEPESGVDEAASRDMMPAGAPSSVTLRGTCFSLPLVLERTVTLAESSRGWRIDLDYKLTNTGTTPVPWSWAAHPLFLAEAGDRVVLPDSIESLRLEGSGGQRLGKKGDSVSWPMAKLAAGGETDLSVAQPPESGIGDKLFAGPVSNADNWCALERPSAGVRIRVSFDAAATPYIGLWICHGGWPDRPGPKQTCVALEPATAPVDSLAQTGPWSRTLNGDAWSTWTMRLDLELI